MKNQFGHYFNHSPESLKQLTKKALFSFDASFLLDLYRVNEAARSQLFSVLETFSEQVWLTHQAADEFLRNRLSVIASLRNKHRSATSIIDKHVDKLKTELSAECVNHPHLDATRLTAYFDKAAVDAKQLIENSSSAHPALSNNSEDDPILKRVLDLFDGRVGEPFADGELPALLKESDRRYQQGIPPGFRDKDKDSNQEGDFLIWKQLMTVSKLRKRPVIFVTSDRKDDWWESLSGKVIGAHPLLRKEFKTETDEEFVLYATAHFGEVFMPKTSESSATLQEIRRVAEASEVEKSSKERVGETTASETHELQNSPLQFGSQEELASSGSYRSGIAELVEFQNRLRDIVAQRNDLVGPALSAIRKLGEMQLTANRLRHGILGALPENVVRRNRSPILSTGSLGGVRLHSTGIASTKTEKEPSRATATRKKRKSAKRVSSKKRG